MVELINYSHNVLFITLDSCRWDTYSKAKTPNLDRIGKAKKAQTNANYTFPAHHSFFIGHLPSTGKNEDFYSRKGAYLWRLDGATKNTKKVGVRLKGNSIIEGYRNKGYSIKGFAGTSIFSNPNSPLRKYFKDTEFTHFGLFSYHNERTSRKVNPLFNLKEIVNSITSSENWFIFINESATHSPYNINKMSRDDKILLKEVAPFFGGTQKTLSNHTPRDGKRLHKIQIRTLELIDKQIGKLLNQIPRNKPLLIVICGDHGELFGENGKWGHLQNEKEVLTVPLLINPKFVN